MSFNQAVQTSAGHQRLSNWLDELPTKAFFDEQVPRMMAVFGADMILSYTVTKDVGYLFDLIWTRAKEIYRSDSIIKYYKEKKKQLLVSHEITDSEFEKIAIFHGSSFDNPTLSPKNVRETMHLLHSDCDDENVMDMRLFCIFQEISAFIFPSFNMRTHVIKPEKYFSERGEVILN
jgi:hypothetical protein